MLSVNSKFGFPGEFWFRPPELVQNPVNGLVVVLIVVVDGPVVVENTGREVKLP